MVDNERQYAIAVPSGDKIYYPEGKEQGSSRKSPLHIRYCDRKHIGSFLLTTMQHSVDYTMRWIVFSYIKG
jgi:hypothetical protein